MAVMGASVIIPALPQVGQELSISPGRVGLLPTAFTLPGVAIYVGLLVLFVLDNPETRADEGLKQYLLDFRDSPSATAGPTVRHAGDVRDPVRATQLTYLPILLYGSFGASAFVTGLVLSSASLVTALTASQLGRLTQLFGGTVLVRSSFILYIAAIPLMPPPPRCSSSPSSR